MKKVQYFITAAAMIALVSCGGTKKEEVTQEVAVNETEVQEDVAESAEAYKVDLEKSTLAWKGTKIVGEGHNGTISLTDGNLMISEGSLVGGDFIVDMTSMENEDLPNDELKAKLIGHLSTGDFFTVDSFPTAQFSISSVSGGTITGDLTIKGKTNPVSFPYEFTTNEDGTVSASGTIKFDRTQFGVVYGSGNFFADLAKDKVIADEIELMATLVAGK